MKRFEQAFAEWVLTHRLLIILATLTSVGVFAWSAAQHLYFDSSYRVFFSADNPQLRAFETMERTYSKNDNLIFVVAPKKGDVFTRDALDAIEALTAAAWQLPFSTRVDSITNFQYTEAEEDDLIVRDMVSDAGKLTPEQLAAARTAVLTEPALIHRLINDSGDVTAVVATVTMPDSERTTATVAIVEHARKIIEKFKDAHPANDVYLTGMVALDNAFAESSVRDTTYLVPLSFGLMIATVALLVGGFWGTLVTVFVIVASIVWALGGAGYAGFPMTSVTTSAPIIILTVAVANSVHLLNAFQHAMRLGKTKPEAMKESLQTNLQPVSLASLTTAIGFLTMNFSDAPPFHHLGNMVAIGILASLLLTITLLPAVMTLVPVMVRATRRHDGPGMNGVSEFIIRYRRGLLWASFVVVVVALANLSRNELNDNFATYIHEPIQFRVDTDFMLEHLTGIYTLAYSLDSGEAEGISNPAFLHDVERFAQWLETQPEVIHVDRLTTVMKRLNKNMHGDDEAYARLPDDRELAAQYLLLYEMSLPYGLDLNNQINVDKSATRLNIITHLISSNEMIALDDRAEAWMAANLPAVKNGYGASTALMFSHIGRRNIQSMLGGTTIGLVLISGILIVALRSLKLGLVSLIPNIAPAAIGFGLWGIFVGEVGLGLSMVMGMTFGIVIDDTVHFLSKYLHARREKGLSSDDAVRYAFNVVGRALVVTSITLIIGFSVLATSSFEINSAMGLLTAIIILIALVGVFLMLPPLLMAVDGEDAGAVSDSGALTGKVAT